MLPGVACVYYGQEIGMTFNYGNVTFDDLGDNSRLPMQWDSSMNAGKQSSSQIITKLYSNLLTRE